MNLKKRKQNKLIFAAVVIVYATLMASIYFMNSGNYTLRTASFALVILVSFAMPSDKIPILISLLFPLDKIVRLSDNSRTVLPFVVIIFIVKAFSHKMLKPANFLLFFLPFGIFTAMNMMSGMSNFGSFINPLVTCTFILFAYILSHSKKDDNLNFAIATAFITSSLIAAVFSTLFKDLALEIGGTSEYAQRLSGFSSPWNFGFCMLLAWCFTAILFKQKKIKAVTMLILSVIFVYFAIGSGTRSVLIGMCIVFFYILFNVSKKFIKNEIIFFAIMFALIPIAVILYIVMIYRPMIESRGQFYDSSRLELWSYYMNLVSSDIKVLLFGLGCNNLATYALDSGMLTAHSIFVEMVVELGVVGLIFFIYLIAVMFVKAQKNPFKNDMMIPIILYCTFLFTQGGLSTELLYFLIALACQTYPSGKQDAGVGNSIININNYEESE